MKLAHQVLSLCEDAGALTFADLNQSTFKEFEDVLATVANKKAPSGMKKEMDAIKFIYNNLKSFREFSSSGITSTIGIKNIENSIKHIGVEKLDACLKKLTAVSNEPITTANATFINDSTLSGASFKAKVKELDHFLSTLKKPHSDAIGKDCVIRFVRKELSKASAKYKSLEKEIYLRPDRKIVDGDNYGSFVYVLLHELGHRYEASHKIPDFSKPEWITTKYSRKETWSGGGEHFAELFSMSHWPEKYPEYADKITKCLELLKEVK